MSRKHPDRRMLIPLRPQERAMLRTLARGGSLGDTLRRLVQAGLQEPTSVVAAVDRTGATRLPLQLPRGARRAVEALAHQQGSTPEVMVLTLMYAALHTPTARDGRNSQ